MRRFMKDGLSWEIELEGKTFQVIDDGTDTRRKFVSPEHARTQHDKAIAAKLADGWMELDLAAAPRVEELPLPLGDLVALAVRADELQELGDFRGELVAIQLEQHRLADDDSKQAAAKRRKLAEGALAIIDANRRAVFGWLARVADATTVDGPPPAPRPVVVTFRLGVGDAVHLRASASFSLSEAWNELARSPLSSTFRFVTCGSSAPPRTDSRCTYVPFLLAFAKYVPPNLTELFLGDLPDEELANVDLGDVGFLKDAAPKLERLTLRGASLHLGALPRGLRELKLEGRCVTSEIVGELEAAPPPDLEVLTLLGGRQPTGLEVDVAPRVFRLADQLPKLRRLALGGVAPVPIDALAERPVLSRLTHLDLNRCELREAGGEQVLALADRFEHLTSFGLRMNGFSDDLVEQIRKRLPRAKVLGQWELRHEDDDDERYDDIDE